MMRLSAFADEISPDLDKQIESCRQCGVTHLELRGVWDKNVLDLTHEECQKIKSALAGVGMEVLCIASPIGKVRIDEPWEPHFERFKIAVGLADFFSAPFIRIFSYYPPQKGQSMLPHRQEVFRRMRAKLSYVKGRPVTLLHENEKEIYGAKGAQCVDLLTQLDSPQFKAAFDFANFVQEHESPLDAWPGLKPYTVHVHVKDAIAATGVVVPAGQGDGQLEPILLDLNAGGYSGFLSLEPHLKTSGQFDGTTGPELFKEAADALKNMCRKNRIPLAGA
jgi:3-dehydroshikimate dehydratase